jgi:VWFA-related protein
MKRLAACVVVFFFLVPIAFAQDAPPPPPKREAPVAVLSVVVTDARGNHIPSLTKDDFQVAIGGAPLTVAKFAERGAEGVPTGELRRIAIVFDTTTLSAGARRQTADSVRGFLASTLRPGDLCAVLSSGQSLRAMTGWTADPKEIAMGLQQMAVESSIPMSSPQAVIEKRIREIATDIQQAGKANHTFYTFDALIDAARAYAANAYRDSEQTLSVMASSVSLFTPRTRNVLIVVGGGLSRTPGAGVFQYVEGIRNSAQRGQLGTQLQSGAAASSPMGEVSSYDLTPLFNSFGTRAWRRGVVFYAICPDISEDSGSRIDMQQPGDRLAAFTNTAARFDGYHLLAEETGGVAFVGRSAADAFERITADLNSFYSVGVRPTAPISGMEAVSVKVNNGHRVRVTRGSASAGTPADEMESRVIANHLLKASDNSLGISLNAAAPVPDGERRLVTVDVMIPIHKLKLVSDGESLTGAFTVFIATGDSVGHSSNVTRQTKEIRWPADALARAGDKPLTFRVNVVLEPGRSQISVGVMDEKSKEKGFDRLSV